MAIEAFRYYTEWNDYANRKRYAAPADPWQLVRVDPGEITEYRTVSLKWGLGRVRGGDWDRTDRQVLAETKLYAGLEQRFVQGKPWEATAYYEWGQEGLADAESFRGCTDIEEFVNGRCTALDGMVEELQTEGYRPNYGHRYDSPTDLDYVHDMEPIVLIARDGELLLTEGYHRVVLGQLLDVGPIPVHVLCRHEAWQQVRETVHENGEAPVDVTESHPDLQDVLPSEDPNAPNVRC